MNYKIDMLKQSTTFLPVQIALNFMMRIFCAKPTNIENNYNLRKELEPTKGLAG